MTTFIKDTNKNRLINISKASHIECDESDYIIRIHYKTGYFTIEYTNRTDTLAAYDQICLGIRTEMGLIII